MMNALPELEERIRSLTDNFKATQWAVLYHNLDESSFFFRRRGGRVDIAHSNYPIFFKNIFSIKQEWTTTEEEAFPYSSYQNIGNLILGSSRSSKKSILILPVVSRDRGIKGGEKWRPLATIIAGELRSKSIPSSTLGRVKLEEKKILQKIVRLFAFILEIERERITRKADVLYREGREVQNFSDWISKVKQGTGASNYHLYWVDGKSTWLYSSDGGKKNKPVEFELLLKHGISKTGVDIWNRSEIKIHSKLKSKVNFGNGGKGFLVLTFAMPEEIIHKVMGAKTTFKKCYLVVLFSQRPMRESGFHDIEFLYSQRAWEEGKKYLDDQFLLNHIEASQQSIQSLDKESTNLAKDRPTHLHQFTLYQKNQLHLAMACPSYSNSQSWIKTDLKAGLNVGNIPSRFMFFKVSEQESGHQSKMGLKKDEHKIISSGIDYFFNRSVDMVDYGNKIQGFFSEVLGRDPLEKYIFLTLDAFTTSLKNQHSPEAKLGIVSKGYHIFHYSFESGTLKKLPDYKYCFTLVPVEEDIVLALPTQTDNKKNYLKQLENNLVVFGQAFPDKLVRALGQGCRGQEFFLVKKPRII